MSVLKAKHESRLLKSQLGTNQRSLKDGSAERCRSWELNVEDHRAEPAPERGMFIIMARCRFTNSLRAMIQIAKPTVVIRYVSPHQRITPEAIIPAVPITMSLLCFQDVKQDY